jgi:hypothetical protein
VLSSAAAVRQLGQPPAGSSCARATWQRRGWAELLLPEIERLRALGIGVVFRGDAAFARPELYEALEERELRYAIRLPTNANVERNITELLKRPMGRPSRRPLVRYQCFPSDPPLFTRMLGRDRRVAVVSQISLLARLQISEHYGGGGEVRAKIGPP